MVLYYTDHGNTPYWNTIKFDTLPGDSYWSNPGNLKVVPWMPHEVDWKKLSKTMKDYEVYKAADLMWDRRYAEQKLSGLGYNKNDGYSALLNDIENIIGQRKPSIFETDQRTLPKSSIVAATGWGGRRAVPSPSRTRRGISRRTRRRAGKKQKKTARSSRRNKH